MPVNKFIGLLLAWFLVGVRCACCDDSEASKYFDSTIAPILARRCLDCHSGADPKGGLDLSARDRVLAGGDSGPALVPGDLEESALFARIEAGEMPPKLRLPEDERVAVRDWIARGAIWGTDPIDVYQATTSRRAGRDWWALQPLVRPAVPEMAAQPAQRNPIDVFVRRELAQLGLQPNVEADRRTLIRRLSFDLLGLPPAPEEVARFVDDPDPAAYERLVDRYLGSPHYGVRWARRWLDLARYGESNGFEYDEFRPSAWRYRDWVVAAWNENMPYDMFARLQLAGDAVDPGDASAAEATGFLVAGAYDTVGQNQKSAAMKAVVRADELEDMIGTVGQTFLGLTINCARCHDHKFDPIPQVEYYGMVSALSGVRHGQRDLSELAPQSRVARARLDAALSRLDEIERPARLQVLANRGVAAGWELSIPVAAWDFTNGPRDLLGTLDAHVEGGAQCGSEGLVCDGRAGFARTGPLSRDLREFTLEAWVKVEGLSQRGGGVISLQSVDGGIFDAIVWAEREPERWMAGSEGYARTRDVNGPPETDAATRAVHVAITHDRDGWIRIYREGQPYGEPYRVADPVTHKAGSSQVLFGLRHTPAGGNRHLRGWISRARLYDRAVSPEQLAASAIHEGLLVAREELIEGIPESHRAEHRELMRIVERLRSDPDVGPRMAYVNVPRQPDPTHVLMRGDPRQPADLVGPRGVSAVRGLSADFGLPVDAPEAERRKKLAEWITDSRNPLFARVLVNRLWEGYFGAGLVETPSDFGFNGGQPSHPALLDWLAAEFVESGYNIKAMQRLIVMSATYRQASTPNFHSLSIDAGNRLLWRRSPRRLEAEMLRDAMLAAADRLMPQLGGPSYMDVRIVDAPGTPAVLFEPLSELTEGPQRRTLYRAWARGGRSSLLDAFDCPDPSTAVPRRSVTTTPLQALSLLNNALVFQLADAFGDRLRREVGDDPARQVEHAYQIAFGRGPSADEQRLGVAVVSEFGTGVLARAIFNSNEFIYVH